MAYPPAFQQRNIPFIGSCISNVHQQALTGNRVASMNEPGKDCLSAPPYWPRHRPCPASAAHRPGSSWPAGCTPDTTTHIHCGWVQGHSPADIPRPAANSAPAGPVDPPKHSRFISLDGLTFGLLRGINPKTPTALGCGRRGSARRNAARSAGPPGDRSTSRCQSRMLRRPSQDTLPIRVFVACLISAAGPVPAWRPGPFRLVGGRPGANGRHFEGSFSASRRFLKPRNPADSTLPPVVVAAPTVLGFLEVSYRVISACHAN